MKPIFGMLPGKTGDVKIGDVFYNAKRGNCLKVNRVYDVTLTHIGGLDEILLCIKVSTLRCLPYYSVERIEIQFLEPLTPKVVYQRPA